MEQLPELPEIHNIMDNWTPWEGKMNLTKLASTLRDSFLDYAEDSGSGWNKLTKGEFATLLRRGLDSTMRNYSKHWITTKMDFSTFMNMLFFVGLFTMVRNLGLQDIDKFMK